MSIQDILKGLNDKTLSDIVKNAYLLGYNDGWDASDKANDCKGINDGTAELLNERFAENQ